MPPKPCYWTRKLELQLVEFVRQKDCIWKPGNTNHHIQQKYKAYAEFAAKLGKGFTARSVRDRWVNIRSTFNHNLRKVDKSKETAQNKADIFVPCWPLWKPLQFLRTVARKEFEKDELLQTELKELTDIEVKEEQSDCEDPALTKREKNRRTDRPRRRTTILRKPPSNKCKKVLNDLITSMKPLLEMTQLEHRTQSYWFFGRHVTERLNAMRENDAACARQEIMNVLNEFRDKGEHITSDDDTT